MFRRRLSLSLCAVALAFSLTTGAFAQELQGAEAALKAAAEARGAKEQGTDPAGWLKRQLDEMRAGGRTMAPAVAAQKWLVIFDALDKGTGSAEMAMGMGGQEDFGSLVGVLPAPESWPEITKGIRQRTAKMPKGLRPASLNVFAEMLTGDAASQWKAMAEVMPYSKERNGGGYYIQALYQALAQRTGDKARLLRAMTMAGATQPGTGETVVVPDLVAMVGVAEAEKSLTKLLSTSTKLLYITQGKRTKELAARLALAHVKTLKVAQWGLVSSPRDTKLYEALGTRFGTIKAKGGYTTREQAASRARSYYLIGLVLEGREAEALKIAKALGAALNNSDLFSNDDPDIEALVGTPKFTKFLGELVKGNPKSSLWTLYTVSATRSRNVPAIVASLNAELSRPNLSADTRAALRTRLASAYLAMDKVDEGLAVMKKLLSDAPTGAQGAGGGVTLYTAIQYARIGHLLNRPAVVEEGLAMAKKLGLGQPGMEFMGASYSLVDLLMDLGRPAEAEKIAIANYAAYATMGDSMVGMGGMQTNPGLSTLLTVYYKQNRPEEVRILLDKAPDWGMSDISELAAANSYTSDGGEGSSGFIAAWALAKTGETAKAEALIYRVLANSPGFDPAYSLFVELKGKDSLPALDRLFSADQFQ
ncbi:hypothetical protein EON81_08910, partial [bacterium]